MSKQAVQSWRVVCDWPDCDHEFEYDMYSVFGDSWDVDEIVTEGDGRLSRYGHLHYCRDHPAAWASDPEQVADMSPPFLLIHDGDTDNADDDGRVTFMDATPRRTTSATGRETRGSGA